MNAPTPDEIGFRPVTLADLPMLGEWMARPHWREWWGEQEEELANVRAMVEGRDTSCRPFLVTLAGAAEGYIQVWQVAPHLTPQWTDDNPWLLEVPAGAVGVDLSLADGVRLSQGIGSAALRAFVAMLRDEGRDTIVIDPDPANGRAVAAYRKAGFRPIPRLEGRYDDVLIMQFHPDTVSS